MKRTGTLTAILLVLFCCLCGCSASTETPIDYSDTSNWAYLESNPSELSADVFFIGPTVYSGAPGSYNMPMSDSNAKADFLGATNMEKGIYDADSRFFAPYYRQVGLNVYAMDEADRQEYLEKAFADVKDAFEYYYEHYNDGRPIILAGFSQGADMAIRLLKESFASEDRQEQLVACYAPGWRLTEEEVEEYSALRPAQSADDTGVVISFNSEAEYIEDSPMIPRGVRTLAINPLNWRTDSTYADRSLNEGACFTDYSGSILDEEAQLTGAYIDPERGALKVLDVTAEEYPAGLDIFEDGVYHLYDYQFFYRNLQDNVRTRLDAYLCGAEAEAALAA